MDKKKIEDWLQELAMLATRFNNVRINGELRTMDYFMGLIRADLSKPHIHLPHDVFEDIVKVLDVSVTMDVLNNNDYDLYFEMFDCYFFAYYKERDKDGKDK